MRRKSYGEVRGVSKTLSRRAFLKCSAAAGAIFGLSEYSYCSSLASSRILGANERILIGVIGCGNRGMTHINGLLAKSKSSGRLAIVGVCDIYQPRKQRAKEKTNADAYHDYRDMIEQNDIDAVIIATPDHWHARMAIDAMEAGKDVYLEKPMTYTWKEAKEVYETAVRTGRVLQVGAQSCSDEKWWQANRLIREGALGKVLWTSSSYCRNSRDGEWNYKVDDGVSPDNLDWESWLGPAPKRPFDPERFFRWRKYWDYSGGIATDLFYHQLSHLQIALGPEFPKRVSAGGGIYVQYDRDVPDTFHMIIDYPSDHSVVLCSSMANRQGLTEVIRGHEATMYFEPPGIVIRPESEFKDSREELHISTDSESSKTALQDHMDNWLDCIRSRNKPNLDAETAYKVMVAIALGVKSYREEKVFRFDAKKEKEE